MFHGAISASVMGLPSPGVSALTAAKPSASAQPAAITATEKALRIDMLDPPIGVDAPARDAVVVLVGEAERVGQWLLGLSARGDEFGAQRLHVAAFVPGAALQHHRLAVPAPRHTEAREGLGLHRLLQRRLSPALSPIGRNHDLGDAAVPGIRDAGDLVEAWPFQ